jgi:hypothetical protein
MGKWELLERGVRALERIAAELEDINERQRDQENER